MSNTLKQKQTGFTTVELLIVIVVIGILAAITIVAYNGIQARAYDSQRVSDLQAIVKAIRIYEIDHGHLPREGADNANGKVGEGGGLDTLLAPYLSTIPHDPLGPGNAQSYYYYDGNQLCGGSPNVALLFATNMQADTEDDNPCTSYGGEGGSNDPTAYHIVLGRSDG